MKPEGRDKGLFSFKFIKDTMAATVVSTAGKAIGFVVPFLLATWFGSTVVTDSFFFMYSIALFLAGIVASTVSVVIVPYIADLLNRKENPGPFVNTLLAAGSAAVGLLLLAVGLVLFLLVSFTTIFEPSVGQFILFMYLSMIPLVMFLVATGIIEGVLVANKRFMAGGTGLVFRSLVTVAMIFFLRDIWGIHAVAAGYVAGEMVRLAFLVIVVRIKRIFRFGFYFTISARLIDFFNKAFYQVLGVIAVSVNPVIDKIMATWFPGGSVSLLYYGERFYMIPETLLVGGIMVTLLSYLSSRIHVHGIVQLKHDVARTAMWMALSGIVLTGIFIALAGPFVSFAYGNGEMTPAQLSDIAHISIAYFSGFAMVAVAQVYIRALIVLKNTKAIMMMAFVKTLGNFVLNLVLMNVMGIAGIAWATSCMNLVGLVIVFSVFRFALGRGIKGQKRGEPGMERPVPELFSPLDM
ncbi:MAG: hypothetical protein EHM28_10515 [Spirochaetaceae bacterium]|nr:MAG: hypothetical protein EHM28_10515 [Spirochaetaceae bacterium]